MYFYPVTSRRIWWPRWQMGLRWHSKFQICNVCKICKLVHLSCWKRGQQQPVPRNSRIHNGRENILNWHEHCPRECCRPAFFFISAIPDRTFSVSFFYEEYLFKKREGFLIILYFVYMKIASSRFFDYIATIPYIDSNFELLQGRTHTLLLSILNVFFCLWLTQTLSNWRNHCILYWRNILTRLQHKTSNPS